jgi:hypothetical protein
MRAALISLLLACGTVRAEVIECPPAYPLAPTPLADDSKAFASRSLLFGGGVFIGELGGTGEMRGDDRAVKDGYDVRFGFGPNEPRWFVCSYGRDGAISSWRTINVKATSCMMRRRTLAGVTTVKADCK